MEDFWGDLDDPVPEVQQSAAAAAPAPQPTPKKMPNKVGAWRGSVGGFAPAEAASASSSSAAAPAAAATASAWLDMPVPAVALAVPSDASAAAYEAWHNTAWVPAASAAAASAAAASASPPDASDATPPWRAHPKRAAEPSSWWASHASGSASWAWTASQWYECTQSGQRLVNPNRDFRISLVPPAPTEAGPDVATGLLVRQTALIKYEETRGTREGSSMIHRSISVSG